MTLEILFINLLLLLCLNTGFVKKLSSCLMKNIEQVSNLGNLCMEIGSLLHGE